MSASRRIAFAVAFTWLSRTVTILANLFLLPILFRFMGKEELGLWFLLGNSQAFLGLLGMGVAPILTRQIALAKGKSGFDPGVELTEESKQQIGDLIATGRIALQWLAITVFFIAWGVGYRLINQLELSEVSPTTVIWAWTLMCAGYAVGIWIEYLNCLLIGIGCVGLNNLIAVALSTLTILANIGAVFLRGGLLALASISIMASLGQQVANLGYIHWRKPELLNIQGKWNAELARSIIKPSLHCWLTSLGEFLILKTDQYFIALSSGSSDIPSYHAAYQLASNLRVLAVSITLSSSPFLGQMWQAGNLKEMHRLIVRNCRFSLLIMSCGISFLIVSGKEIIDVWLGSNIFVGYNILVTFCIMFAFEVQNVCLKYSARATGKEDYALSSLGAGILNIGFTMVLVKPLGLWGISLGTFISMIFTDNWYSVFMPLSRLKLSFQNYTKNVILIFLICFFLNLSLCVAVKYFFILNGYFSSWITIISSSTTSIIYFLSISLVMFLSERKKKSFV